MISVGKGDIGPLLHIIPRTITGRDVLGKWAAEGGVIEIEGFAVALVSGRREGIFARVTEEVEGKGACLIRVVGEAGGQGLEDGDVDWPYIRGCGVYIVPGLEEGLEPEDIVGAIQPGIWEAQLGKLLPHGT